jgi:hypothetical protein
MIRTIFIALLLCAVPVRGFSQRWVTVMREELAVRISLRDRAELKPLAAEYQQFVTNRLRPLQAGQVTNIFGPKLETVRTLNPHQLSHTAVLPLFAPDSVCLSGLLVTNDQAHADLYAVGDIGYAEFFYHWDGEALASIVLYFRPDATYPPLKTEDDFPRRLEWEKPKWQAMQKWLDLHLARPATQNEQEK